MVESITSKRLSIRLVHVLFIALIACGAFGAGMLARPWGGSAAPAADIEACVNGYTGGVRMNPAGAINCTPIESKVSWSAADTDTHGVGETTTASETIIIPAGSTAAGDAYCPVGYVATGGGFVTNGWTDIVIMDSVRTDNGAGWHVVANNPSTDPRAAGVNVVCAKY